MEPAIWSPVWRTRISSSGCIRSRSVATRCSMSGRRTFTATVRPSSSRALCTTAIDAVPIGRGSNSAKASRRFMPRSSSTRRRTSGNGTAGPVSRQARNSSATSSPNMPGDEAMIWPNFMKVPPRSWKLRRSGRASCAAGSTPWRIWRSWRTAVGAKWTPITLAMVRPRRSSSRRRGVRAAARVDPRHVLGQGTPRRHLVVSRGRPRGRWSRRQGRRRGGPGGPDRRSRPGVSAENVLQRGQPGLVGVAEDREPSRQGSRRRPR